MPRTSLSGYYSKAFASLQEGTLAVDTASAVFNCTSPFDFIIQLATINKFQYDSSADQIVVASPIKSTTGAVEALRLSTNATDYTGFTLDANGGLAITSVDAAAAAANISITADGTFAVTSTGFNLTGAGAISGATSIACTSEAITLAAAGKLLIDAATTNHTNTDGVIHTDVVAGTSSIIGHRIDLNANTYTDCNALRIHVITGAIVAGDVMGSHVSINPADIGVNTAVYGYYAYNGAVHPGGKSYAFWCETNAGWNFALVTGQSPIAGGESAGSHLTLVSNITATPGNIYFHDTNYFITSAGAITVGAITGTTLGLAGAVSGVTTLAMGGALSGVTTVEATGRIHTLVGAAEALRLSTNADDYTKYTLDINGGLTIESVDAAAAAANIAIIADGSFAVTSTAFNLSAAGAISGATSIDGSGDLTMGTITMPGFSVDADGDMRIKSIIGGDDRDPFVISSGVYTTPAPLIGQGCATRFTGANATAVAQPGGKIQLWGGDGLTTGAGGNVEIKPGSSPSGTVGIVWIGDGTNRVTINRTGIMSMAGTAYLDMSTHNIVTDTTTGTKIGTAVDQKLGFYNVAPVVQPAAADQAAAPAGGTGTTAGAYDTAANRDAAIATINAIRTALINVGIMKGAA